MPVPTATPAEPVTPETDRSPDDRSDKQTTVVRFHIVESDAIAGGRFIDTPKFPKLGFIANQPAMVLSNFQNVRMDQPLADSRAKSYVLRLTATPTDAIAIASLTRANLLKKILISVDEEPIVAPTIFEIIENGELEISSTNRVEIETLRSRLIRISR